MLQGTHARGAVELLRLWLTKRANVPSLRDVAVVANPFPTSLAPMRMSHLLRRDVLAGILGSGLFAWGCRSKDGTDVPEETIGPLVAPSELAARIDEVRANKIAVLYVGPDVLFDRGRIPGARKLGPLDSAEGRRMLAKALADLSPETEVVLYCGCCPVKSCPNVRPASAAARALGRKNIRVLDLPTRFGTDWTEKGYPVERG